MVCESGNTLDRGKNSRQKHNKCLVCLCLVNENSRSWKRHLSRRASTNLRAEKRRGKRKRKRKRKRRITVVLLTVSSFPIWAT